jgi:hypothetical protein
MTDDPRDLLSYRFDRIATFPLKVDPDLEPGIQRQSYGHSLTDVCVAFFNGNGGLTVPIGQIDIPYGAIQDAEELEHETAPFRDLLLQPGASETWWVHTARANQVALHIDPPVQVLPGLSGEGHTVRRLVLNLEKPRDFIFEVKYRRRSLRTGE